MQKKRKKWLWIVPAALVLLLVTACVFIKVSLGWHTQREGLPVIAIAWCNTVQDYRWEGAVIEEAGGNVVELPKITVPGLTYNLFGKLSSRWLDDAGALKPEGAELVKRVDFSETNVEEALEGVDAVIFFGGNDISPPLYREPQAAANCGEKFNPTRDVSDYVLLSYCIENDIPILGICRGMQMLGIVSGAEIAQDIPTYYASLGLEDQSYHRGAAEAGYAFAHHNIAVAEQDSLLRDIVGASSLAEVSSWHHQAITGKEGTDLTVPATADYGGVNLIEAIELQSRSFCLGLQFHPEVDCENVLQEDVSTEKVCDYDIRLGFFKALVQTAEE